MDEFVRAVHWVVIAHFYTFHSWAGMDQFYIWARFLDFRWQLNFGLSLKKIYSKGSFVVD